MLFVALDGARDELEIPASNYWISGDQDSNRAAREWYGDASMDKPFPTVFLSFPSTKDSEWHDRFPTKSTAHIIAEAPYEWFAAWSQGRIHHRGEEYEAIKAKLTRRLLDAMYEQFPKLRGKVLQTDLGTPLSTQFYLRAPAGESYGLSHTPQRFRQEWMRPHSPVPGLYMTGTDTLSAGVFGALVSGFLSAVAVDITVAWQNLNILIKL